MAGKFGKDRPAKSSEGFISHALTGGSGKSNEIEDLPVDRPNQKIKRAYGLDNVTLALDIETSLKGAGGFAGGVDNLKHSLTGTSAVNEEVGAAGSVKHVIIPSH